MHSIIRNHPGKLVCISLMTFQLGLLHGLLFGYVAGTIIDRLLRLWRQRNMERILCAALGKLARSNDGRISAQEIARAEQIFAQLDLSGAKRSEAISHFRRGAEAGFDLGAEVDRLRHYPVDQRIHFLHMLVIFSIDDDGGQPELKRCYYEVLDSIVEKVGISREAFRLVVEMLVAQAAFQAAGGFGGFDPRGDAGHHHRHAPPPFRNRKDTLATAYKALGVSAKASDEEVTKAYRRMVNEFHPDKVISKGLGKDTVRVATEKTQQIQAAYKRIREARGF